MIERILKTMREHKMLPMRSVLVGLSGGADSAVLLNVLCKLSEKHGFTVFAAHVNHGLRGEAADADERFSTELCKQKGVECFVLHADVRAEAERLGMSEELAGRRVRYDFFERLLSEHGIERIATAHHKNDNAETILMNFMRGTGLKGLCGIPYIRGNVIRPLLDVSRAEIEAYCKENGIEFVTDQTNLETVYTRNKTRHILIPEIERQFNPSFTDTITKNARLLSVEEDYIEAETQRAYSECVTDGAADVEKLCKLHPAIVLRVLRRMTDAVCGSADIPAAVIESVLELARRNRAGARIDIARGAYAVIEYGKLVIDNDESPGGFLYELKVGQSLYIPEAGYTVRAEYADEYKRGDGEYFTVPEGASLVIRSRKSGDRFTPWGMDGTKSVKNYMVDRKIPRRKRDSVGILTINGDIAWIIGYRRADGYKFNKKGIKISVLY